MHTCTHANTHTTHTRMSACAHTNTHAHTHAHAHAHTLYTHTHAHTLHTHACVHARAHTRTHARTHKHTHLILHGAQEVRVVQQRIQGLFVGVVAQIILCCVCVRVCGVLRVRDCMGVCVRMSFEACNMFWLPTPVMSLI